MLVLQTTHLSKTYAGKKILDQLNLRIPKGSIYGLLGPNGSGKTTTLGILLGAINPSKGTFKWQNDLSRKKIGSLLETPNFYPYMSAYANLRLVCTIKKIDPAYIPRVLDTVGLSSHARLPFKNYSLGMKQRLAIASAILGQPEVLVLDEPTNGLDPKGIIQIRELIKSLHQKGITIILASHLLDEVEKVCTDMAILQKGILLKQGTVSDLLSTEIQIELNSHDNYRLKTLLSHQFHILSIQEKKDGLILSLSEDIALEKINEFAFNQGITLSHLRKKTNKLEEQFLKITAQK